MTAKEEKTSIDPNSEEYKGAINRVLLALSENHAHYKNSLKAATSLNTAKLDKILSYLLHHHLIKFKKVRSPYSKPFSFFYLPNHAQKAGKVMQEVVRNAFDGRKEAVHKKQGRLLENLTFLQLKKIIGKNKVYLRKKFGKGDIDLLGQLPNKSLLLVECKNRSLDLRKRDITNTLEKAEHFEKRGYKVTTVFITPRSTQQFLDEDVHIIELGRKILNSKLVKLLKTSLFSSRLYQQVSKFLRDYLRRSVLQILTLCRKLDRREWILEAIHSSSGTKRQLLEHELIEIQVIELRMKRKVEHKPKLKRQEWNVFSYLEEKKRLFNVRMSEKRAIKETMAVLKPQQNICLGV